MVAPQLLPQPEKTRPRPRVAPHSKGRRRRRAFLLQYGSSAKVLVVLAMVLAPVMLYVMLTSNLTSLNYALASAEASKAKLSGDVQRLDDRIAYLQSRERLLQVASKLGMKDASQYAIVSLQPPAKPKAGGLAFLSWLSLDRARDKIR